MLKKSLFVITLIILVIISLTISTKFINYDKYKFSLIQYFKNVTGKDFEIKGKITLNFSPFPVLILTDCNLIDNQNDQKMDIISHADVEISLNLIPLLIGKTSFDKIILKNANVNVLIPTKEEQKTNLFQYLNFNVSNLTLINTSIKFIKSNAIIANLKDVTALIKNNKKTFDIDGFFISDKIGKVRLKMGINDITLLVPKIHTSFTSDLFTLSIDGTLSNNNQNETKINYNFETIGKASLQIKDLSKFSNQYLMDFQDMFSKITSSEDVQLDSDFKLSQDEVIFNNITLKANSIQGSGTIKKIFDKVSILDFDMHLTDIDIDNLIQLKEKSQINIDEQKALEVFEIRKKNFSNDKNSFNFDFTSKTDILIDLKIDKLKFNNNNFNTIKLNAVLSNNIIDIYNASIEIDQKSKIELEGIVTSNGKRPLFKGKFTSNGTDINKFNETINLNTNFLEDTKFEKFFFEADIIITPREISFYNLSGIMDEAFLKGYLILRFNNRTAIDGEILIDSLNFDKFNIQSKLYKAMSFNEQENDSFLKKLHWIRKINFDGNINFAFKNSYINELFIKEFSVMTYLNPGLVRLDDFNFNSDDINFAGGLYIDMRAIKPKFLANLKGEKFNIKSFYKNFFQEQISSSKENVQKTDETQPLKEKIDSSNHVINWSKNEIKTYNFELFDGSIKLYIENLITPNYEIQKFDYEGVMQNGIININKLNGNIFGGNLEIQGLLCLRPGLLSISYTFNNTNLRPLLQTLLYLDKISGYASLSGVISTKGQTPYDLISFLQAEGSSVAKDVRVEGFNLNSLVENSLLTNYEPKEFNKIIEGSTKGETIFSDVEGSFIIKSGLLQTNSLTLSTERTRGVFNGNIDLRSYLMNSITEFVFIPRTGDNTISITVQLSDLLYKPTQVIKADALKQYLESKRKR